MMVEMIVAMKPMLPFFSCYVALNWTEIIKSTIDSPFLFLHLQRIIPHLWLGSKTKLMSTGRSSMHISYIQVIWVGLSVDFTSQLSQFGAVRPMLTISRCFDTWITAIDNKRDVDRTVDLPPHFARAIESRRVKRNVNWLTPSVWSVKALQQLVNDVTDQLRYKQTIATSKQHFKQTAAIDDNKSGHKCVDWTIKEKKIKSQVTID